MKKLEHVFGALGGVAFAGTALLAAQVAGTFLYRMPPAEADAATLSSAQEGAASAPDGTVELAQADTPAPATTAAAPAALDPAAGEKLFKKCSACHTVDKGGANRVGPNLWGVLDRPVAAHEGFKYSDAMVSHQDETWSAAQLDAYLTKPKDVVPGTAMAFAGLPKAEDRHNLIAWLGTQSDTPTAPEALPFATASAGAEAPAAVPEAGAAPDAPDAAEIAQIPYTNPPERTPAEQAAIEAKVAALKAELPGLDYQRARYHPLHFPPAIAQASNEECLVCHQEIMTEKPRAESLAGVKAADSTAWYQTLDTYSGDQQGFHWRHLQSDFAQEVMNLQCNFCHKGNDPREESPDMIPGRAAFSASSVPEFTNRKMVNPETTCLRCHGAMPDPVNIMGLPGPWPEARADIEDASDPATANGCLTCHGDLFRTNRHEVTYLKGANIEALAKEVSSDTCYGCHGGRQWYRISYPYPRHPWPGMDPETPEWAKDRPTLSDPEYRLAPAAGQ